MKYIFSAFSLIFCLTIYSQSVGIGTTSPNASAILDISSTTKGMLLPRMSTAQRDAIITPVQGLSIFNIDDRCTDIYTGQSWSKNCTMEENGPFTLPANSWRPRTDFGGTLRENAVGFSIENKGYIGTGIDVNYKKDFWEFDPTTNVWTQKADFAGTARYAAVGFSVGSKGYIGTGFDGTWKKDFWEYDVNTNVWTQKSDFAGFQRYYALGFSISTKGYIGTGNFNTFTQFKDFWEYDPSTNLWTQKADFGGTARYTAVGFSIGSKGYIGTGNDGTFRKDFWEFTPAGAGLGSWSQKADFGGLDRTSAVGFSIGNKGYIGTGFNGDWKKDFWEYDPITNSWTQKADFGGTGRTSAVGFSIGTNGYIGIGGNLINVKKDFWEYSTTPTIGKEYTEAVPLNAVKYKSHDWTSEGNRLYNTVEGVDISFSGNTSISGNNFLELGKGILNKESNAGKIGYQTYTDALDIIGAGTSYPNRKIKVFDRLFFENILDNRKLVLWETAPNAHQFYGLGIESGTMRYQVAGAGNVHRFYAGTSPTTSNLLMTIFDNGNTTISGAMCATAYNCASDERLKKNILPIASAVSSLLKLQGYNYHWKDEQKDQKLQSGLLAQEVEKYFPHLVTKDNDGLLSVNYIGLMPYMLETIKSQQNEIEWLKMELQQTQRLNEDLKNENDVQSSANTDIKSRLEKLETLFYQTFKNQKQ